MKHRIRPQRRVKRTRVVPMQYPIIAMTNSILASNDGRGWMVMEGPSLHGEVRNCVVYQWWTKR